MQPRAAYETPMCATVLPASAFEHSVKSMHPLIQYAAGQIAADRPTLMFAFEKNTP